VALLTGLRKVEEGLDFLFRELHGKGTRVEGFEDITVGWETQIVAFRLLLADDEPLELVVRIYSGSNGGKKAEWEFNVINRLGANGYPVPKVYLYKSDCETLGSPFLIMERIRGGVLWDVFFGGPREKYSDVLALNASLMAQLHAILPAKILPGIKRVKTRQRVREKLLDEAEEIEKYELKTTFEPLIVWLRNNVKTVKESPLCIIHQDLHPRNILLRQDGSPVVIDWAGCAFGDFREDLCWMGLLAGTFIDESLKKAIYDSYEIASPRTLTDLPYFEAFAGLRRLVDVAISFKTGADARGMRLEAISEMKRNRPHYVSVLTAITNTTGVRLPELAHLLGV
jgi:aminoglycoside phosphotransferase (APT) family kinase protein